MSAITTTDHAHDRATTDTRADRRIRGWHVAGIGAALSGYAGTMLGSSWIEDTSVYAGGPEAVVAQLGDALPTQLAAFAGYVSVALLVWFGVGLVRLLFERAPRARELVGATAVFLTAAVATMSVGFMMKSVLASGMPGGMDVDYYTTVDTAVAYTLANQLQFAGFLPLIGAAGAVAVLALRHRALPRWAGVASAVVAGVVVAVTAALNLPWSAGLFGPVWLVLVSIAATRPARRETA